MIEASAPVRICDNGGWTDTWFGGPGRVLNIAVKPGVSVFVRTGLGRNQVMLDVDGAGDRYAIVPRAPRDARHPLVEAAVDALPPPDELGVEVSIRSAVPAGCSAGTSAAVAVALLGALAAARSEQMSRRDLAYAAHRLEVDVLGAESGIQDQLSAALGGINYIEIDTYPDATVHSLAPWEELSPRLTLLYVGRAHDSSSVHQQVIEYVTRRRSTAFARLREAAVAARDAVVAQDLVAFGQAMSANTEAQRSLHPDLVGADARGVIDVAARDGALGSKVNGAGGHGGSLTILSATPTAKDALESRLVRLDPHYRVLPIRISSVGLQVRGALEASHSRH